MDKKLLKRRLIGAAVLVGLAVIFIPMILSGGRDEMSFFGSNIPDKPKNIERLKSIEIPRPGAPEKPEEVRLPVDKHTDPASKDTKNSVKAKETKPRTLNSLVNGLKNKNKTAIPKAWAVQVGSFAKRDNALALQKRLRTNKYPAFVEFVKTRNKSVYRVRIGPEVKREKAEAILKDVKNKLDINGVVVSHP